MNRLLPLLLVFLIWAPAFALTPDQIRKQHSESQRMQDARDLSYLVDDWHGSITYNELSDTFGGETEINKEFCKKPEIVRRAVVILSSEGWDVSICTFPNDDGSVRVNFKEKPKDAPAK